MYSIMPAQAPSGASCFTDNRSNCDIQREYQQKYNAKNSHELREQMQKNYSGLVNSTRNAVIANQPCASLPDYTRPAPSR